MSLPPLISAQELNKSFGVKVLFEGISFSVNPGEKVALIGPNGSGKSTLLRILAGLEESDKGKVQIRKDLRSTYVPQEDFFPVDLNVSEVLTQTLVALGQDEFEIAGKVSAILNRSGFSDQQVKVSTLSGGWRKRLAILRGLIVEPEVLLLDEPTNHLDIDGVLWLEELLEGSTAGIVFVTHDRYFIARMAERVFEISRRYAKGFFSAAGDYRDFLEARENYLLGFKSSHETLANTVRREVDWLRQGAKARTTKSKYRSAEAHKLVEELKNSRFDDRRAQLEFSSSNRKSHELIKVEELAKSVGERVLFKDITLTLSPGVRLGIVGPNGSGKTTFIRTLLGESNPDHGRVTRASNLKISFFDQARRNLDRSISLKNALSPTGSDTVIFSGKPIHIASWARRFLFTNEQLPIAVEKLSGGEQARVLLAQLMLQESDIILFDEPTNDLDIETLEVLEESFCKYPGAIVLVTHDRYLLDRTSTLILGLAGSKAAIYSGYLQWEADYRSSLLSQKKNEKKVKVTNSSSDSKRSKGEVKKLSFGEQKELKGIETKISRVESELAELNQEMHSEKISTDAAALIRCSDGIKLLQADLDRLYARWEELESRK